MNRQRFSWVAAIFNFGFLFWALPSNLLLQRLPVAKYTGCMILLWGVLICCQAAANNYAGILVLRFILGMFEVCISPAIIFMISMFYTRSEQPLRMCIILGFNGLSTVLGALMAYGLGHVTHTMLKVWQLIFLVIGALNLVFGVAFVSVPSLYNIVIETYYNS
jgi:MFS family permease